MNVRTRFAPSPTGYLHIGGLRTALYAFLFARKHKGTLILRVEDTDRSRYVPGSVEALIRALERTGITYDEGPILLENGTLSRKGDKGPYLQSERLDLYKQQAQILLDKGYAYYCFCNKERLEQVREQQQLAKQQPKYDRFCLKLSKEEVAKRLAANEPYVIRMQVPEGETSFEDVVRGKVVFKNEESDDQVLMKSDGFPTYHLANVVDDHFMEVTHVIRAEEWISSTPKHLILYNMFGWNTPVFAHLPLILNPDRSKLSKRQGDVAVEDYLAKGYLPEALVNFVALIGYNPKADQEVYPISDLIELFQLEKINASGGVFNKEKLDWMNKEYIRQKTDAELVVLVLPFLEKAGKGIEAGLLSRICHVEKERLVTLADIVEKVEPYISTPSMDPALLVWKKSDANDARTQLAHIATFLDSVSDNTFSDPTLLEKDVSQYIESNGLQKGNVLWPTRVALSGLAASPGPFELAYVLGKNETLKRLRQAETLLAS